ncbi:DUF6894 family protein [Pararhizobium sp. O133]|uniref:DUF6894 family protein n=1 Tax=Pararhizobium sp. O133 TaxID=3449278 RepID=UPI003F687E3A
MDVESLVFRNNFHGGEFLDHSTGSMHMGRYFFDLQNGDGPVRDNDGMELDSRAGVAREISRILLDIAQDEIPERMRGAISIVVRDDNGKAVSVANLTFSNLWLDDIARR